jgi:stage II sporulation protein D
MASSRHRCRRALTTGTVTALAAGALVAVAAAPGGAATAPTPQTYALPKTGSVLVTGNGNGHGHGMSQYGAQGLALKGATAKTIVGFYYPSTVLKTLSATTTMRVWISEAGKDSCVLAVAGMKLTGVSGTLSLAGGITRFRLAPSGAGLMLQSTTQARCGGTWKTVKTGLPATANFSAPTGYVRSFRTDGSSTNYRGTVGSVRQGSGELTINRVGLDAYTEGVVPREMPASWRIAAVQAQAVAARTYGEYEREHAGSRLYDICDTDQCQVYGGMTHYDKTGAVLWTDDPASITAYKGQVLTYGGVAAFTQFSASNGGWSVSGGEPYLVAKADPYDAKPSGDPYLGWSQKVTVKSIAAYFGLASVSKITITKRDGHGQWGGRVLTGTVTGLATATAKKTTTLPVTGFDLQDAMGVPQNWFTISTS